MKQGDLIADLVSFGPFSKMLVELLGWDIHERLMGEVMMTRWFMDDEMHVYFRPDTSAPAGLRIDLELVNQENYDGSIL